MPKPQSGRRLRKREIVFAVAAGALAAGAAAIVLDESNDGGGPEPVAAAEEMTYQVGAFERIATSGPQDIEIAFGETHSVRAEGALARLEVLVENGELIIRPRDGGWDWPGFDSTTLYVTVPRLTRVSLNGPGEIGIDKVVSDRFAAVIDGFGGEIEVRGLEVDQAEFTINGPGEIAAAGTAHATRVTINGPGEIQAGELQSQTATVAVNGPGDVELAVEQEAEVSVEGPGEVDIDGPARCTVTTSGPGSVSCGGAESD
jgi:hypothetical protein